ncbi:methyltransferase domain-containing protein [Candidatus Chlorohelix sp.]|uniref:class I SAM-dependent methyltransferase n=1 Tax=Candidatus Chlorohelix sp. TaxID=3139201 RepID=UPI00305D4324
MHTHSSEKDRIQAAYKGASNMYHRTPGGDFQRSSVRHLLVDLDPVPNVGDSVLDLGCGTGIGIFMLLELYPQIGKIVGLDLSPQMLENARAEAAQIDHPITWLEGDGHKLPLEDNSFNLVISHNAFHWMTDRAKVLQELNRVLVSGGRIALLFEGAGARENQMSVRRRVLSKYNLTPPIGYGTAYGHDSAEAWNTVTAVENLVEEAGFQINDVWARQSYQYIPPELIVTMFRSTNAYWSAGLSQEQTDSIMDEIKNEIYAQTTERGFREIMYPINVIAVKP